MSEDVASLILKADSSQIKGASDDVTKLTQKGKELEDQLAREVALYGKVGRAAGVRYDVEKGGLRGLDAAQKQRLIRLAQEADSLERNTKRAKAFGVALGTTLVAGGVALFGGVLKNTIESENAIAQLESRIKSTGGVAKLTSQDLQDMAAGLQSVTRYGDEAIMDVESLLLTFTRIGRDNFGAATEAVLNLSTAMKTDLNSAALQVGKALNDPIKGVTALSRAGVQFSVDQKKLIKSLVETGKTSEAQKIILGELETQMGGAARAARDTLAGAVDGLTNAFGDLLEGDTKGDGVRGAVEEINNLTDTMNDPAVKQGFQGIAAGVISVTSSIAEGIGLLANYIVELKKARDLQGKVSSGQALNQSEANQRLSQIGTRSGQIRQGLKTGMSSRATFGGEDKAYLQWRTENKKAYDANEELKFLANERMKTMRQYTADLQKEQVAAAIKESIATTTGPGGAPSGGSEGEDTGASDKAAKAAERAAKQRQQDFASLKEQLATEEEAIQTSYEERERIIAESTQKGSADQLAMSARSKAIRDSELADLAEKRGKDLEDLRLSLRTEEEEIKESYAARLKIVQDNTAEGSAARQELTAKVTAEYEADLKAFEDAQQQKRDSIARGYMTDMELLRSYHEERRKEILDSTALTEEMRQELLRREETRFIAESASRERERIAMITSSAGGMFDALGNLIATYAQSSGKEQKKLFKMAQAFSIASAVISIATGISKAQELGYPMNIFESVRVAAVGAAQIATIKSQQYSGAYDQGGHIPAGRWGIVGEYGPERVRGPATVTGRELTARNSGSGAGMGDINVSVQVNGDGSSNVGVDGGDAKQGRQLGQLVGAKCREVMQQEMRPGGLLWRGGVRNG